MNEKSTENKVATNLEVEYFPHEMFVSKTDKKGIIQYGNDLFVRVSGYSREQLIRHPHNIVRHPHMPRSVFKLFWDRLQNNLPVIAYVKNLAADGKHYWVLATAIPTRDGYLSIRLKPNPKNLPFIESLYAELLGLEKKWTAQDLHQGVAQIEAVVGKAGFSSYEKWMTFTLSEELRYRDQEQTLNSLIWNPNRSSRCDRILSEVSQIAFKAAKGLQLPTQSICGLTHFKAHCEKVASQIAKANTRFENLSVNMSVTAHKLGEEGGALATVASSFQTSSQKVMNHFQMFRKDLEILSGDLDRQISQILLIRVQIELLTFLFFELHETTKGKREIDETAFRETHALIQQLHELFQDADKRLDQFSRSIKRVRKQAEMLEGNLMLVDLIRLGGKLEGSRSLSTSETFGPFIQEMQKFTDEVKTPIASLLGNITQLDGSVSELCQQTSILQHGVNELTVLFGYLRPKTMLERAS